MARAFDWNEIDPNCDDAAKDAYDAELPRVMHLGPEGDEYYLGAGRELYLASPNTPSKPRDVMSYLDAQLHALLFDDPEVELNEAQYGFAKAMVGFEEYEMPDLQELRDDYENRANYLEVMRFASEHRRSINMAIGQLARLSAFRNHLV